MNPKHTPPRSIRVDDELWAAAKATAEAEGKTLTDVITAYLRRYAKRKPPAPTA